uniref:Uncharacterized protein n=1 Tax=viral metagenome TaxID=1070528 RepID=A0A6C0JQX6_9ZZZZ
MDWMVERDLNLALKYAASSNNLTLAKLLLEPYKTLQQIVGISGDITNPNNTTPFQDDIRLVKDIDSAIIEACRSFGTVEIVRFLLRYSPERHMHLISACSGGNLDVVKMLINEFYIDPSLESEYGGRKNAALRTACDFEKIQVIKYLLEDPDVLNEEMDYLVNGFLHPDYESYKLVKDAIDKKNFGLDSNIYNLGIL